MLQLKLFLVALSDLVVVKFLSAVQTKDPWSAHAHAGEHKSIRMENLRQDITFFDKLPKTHEKCEVGLTNVYCFF